MEVIEHLNSAFQMGKFFGLAPYDNNLQLDTKLVYYSVFLTFLLIAFWPAEFLMAYYTSDSFSVAHWFDLALLCGTYIVAVYKSYGNVKLLQELSELLKKVDDTSSLHCEFKKSYILRFLVLVLIFVSLLDSITNEEDKLRFWEYLPLIFTLSFEDQFRQTVMIISNRLDTLSSLIRETDISKLIKSYYLLYSAYKKLNEIYSLQIFCYVVSVFSYIISQAYLLCKAFINFSSADDDFKIDLIVYSINFTLRSFQVFLMCHLGSSVTNKCEEFHDKIINLMESDNSDSMVRNDKLQLHVMTGFKMTFSSFGYFELNYSLLQMIASSTAVYVVIIMQFDLSCYCIDSNL